MRNIIVFNMITADGYFEGPKHELDWHIVDAEFNDFATRQLDEADTLLFGRRTFELMAGYWPTESARKDDPVVAEKMNKLEKLVFSHTLKSVDWQNSTIITEDSIGQLRDYRERPGKALLLFGSSNLCVGLLKAGLIDEIRLMVNPIILGKGNPLFGGLAKPLRLGLIRTRTFRSGNVLLCYRPYNLS